jgi:methylmalonyl-CoA/ethylmalonyl-CoA epimerase
MSEAARITQVGQIAIPAQELDRAVAFYRDVLGLRHLFTMNGLAFFDCGGVRLLISRPEQPESEASGCSVLYFRVEDIQAAYASLQGRGAEFVDAPHRIARLEKNEVWMAFFHDSEGNLMSIMSEPAM